MSDERVCQYDSQYCGLCYTGTIFIRSQREVLAPGMANCATCGSYVRDDVPTANVNHDGEMYYFESTKCREMFENEPDKYT